MSQHLPTHIIQCKHHLLVSKYKGLMLFACLDCGRLLGAARHLPILCVVDGLHTCQRTVGGSGNSVPIDAAQ